MKNLRSLRPVLDLYLPFIRQFKWLGILTIVTQVAASLVPVLAPIVFAKLIDSLIIYDSSQSIYYFLLYALSLVFYRLVNFYGDRVSNEFQSRVMRKAGSWGYDHLLRRSSKFFEDNFSGQLINRFDKFITAFEYLHDIARNDVLDASIRVVGVIVALLFINPWLALIFVAWVVFQIVVGTMMISKKVPLSIAKAKAQSGFIGSISDFFTNSFAVISFAAVDQEQKIFDAKNHSLYIARLQDWNYSVLISFVISFLATSFGILAIGASIYLYFLSAISIGTVSLITIYLGNLRNSIRSLTIALDKGSTQLSNALEMQEILQTPIQITDHPQAKPLTISNPSIQFQDTTFNYLRLGSGQDTELGPNQIHNLTLHIPAGQSIGLVGRSGAGKSTLTKLLLRFIDPDEGTITIDEQDIKHVTQESLRKSISYVPQQPLLFHRTLYENISYGKPGCSLDEVIQASKKAHAHEFIQSLEHGYDTLVGERGVKLSGGQRQRVAIARAILKDSPILLLDEATSSLDSESERLIQDSIQHILEDKSKTIIVIAHRLSTIKHLDRIVVLDRGQIVQDGSHKELIKKESLYGRLWGFQGAV